MKFDYINPLREGVVDIQGFNLLEICKDPYKTLPSLTTSDIHSLILLLGILAGFRANPFFNIGDVIVNNDLYLSVGFTASHSLEFHLGQLQKLGIIDSVVLRSIGFNKTRYFISAYSMTDRRRTKRKFYSHIQSY